MKTNKLLQAYFGKYKKKLEKTDKRFKKLLMLTDNLKKQNTRKTF